MPATVRPAPHRSRLYQSSVAAATSPSEILKTASPQDFAQSKSIIQSSYTKLSSTPPNHPLHPSKNSLIHAVISAYSTHHHLTLRPDDIWLAILTQLSLYINAHAEALRSFFVAHSGQRELWITAGGTIHSVDFGALARRMGVLLAENVVDPELGPWVTPDFSTTTDNDKVVAGIVMMGALQQYFSYGMRLMCGIPSATLLGVRDDWVALLARIEKIPHLGPEAAQFHALLKPVLAYFVRTFDAPESAEVKSFWARIADRSAGSGEHYLSGWITTFCMWDADGQSLYTSSGEPPSGPVATTYRGLGARQPGCDLDGTLYHRLDVSLIPPGTASVPVTVDDNGKIYRMVMVAGSMGIRASSSGETVPSVGEPGLDSVQPEVGWIMYEKVPETKAPEGETMVKVDGGGGHGVEEKYDVGVTVGLEKEKETVSSVA